MSTINVHTLGDSTLDNRYWLINKWGSNLEEAKINSAEGNLETQLNTDIHSKYQVISHAYHGFTTSSILQGGEVGCALGINKNVFDQLQLNKPYGYVSGKIINLESKSLFVHPLNDLKKFIEKNPTATHYVVISAGGDDFREPFLNPNSMLKDILNVHKRYMRILQEVKSLKNADVRPILMFQYRLDIHNDCYGIYTVLKIIGIFFTGLQLLITFGIGVCALSLIAKKINRCSSLVFSLISTAFLALSHQVLPLKATKDILMGKNVGIVTLGAFMETFYQPIITQAKKERIPILDLPNTFNPYDSELYTSQIEPSQKGGQLISEGLDHIVKNHDFSSVSKIYNKNSSRGFTGSENRGASHWTVSYPKMV